MSSLFLRQRLSNSKPSFTKGEFGFNYQDALETTHFIIKKITNLKAANPKTFFDNEKSEEIQRIFDARIDKIRRDLRDDNEERAFDVENLREENLGELKNIDKKGGEHPINTADNRTDFSETKKETISEITTKYIIENFSGCEFLDKCLEILDFNKTLLILSLMLLDKILKKVKLTEKNIHKILYLCLIETHKFYIDVPYKNSFYAKIIGIPTEELFILELEFSKLVEYKYNVNIDDYVVYERKMKNLWRSKINCKKNSRRCVVQF